MSYPKAYQPEQGYKYQILCRMGQREWEHCDYAKDKEERRHLVTNYIQAYGMGWEFKSILLPVKYWNEERVIKA